MDTKLTLKLNGAVIQKAKEYASRHKTSLSRLVESYLKSIMSEDQKDDLEISPFIRSLSKGGNIPADFDYKKEYTDHLIKKHR